MASNFQDKYKATGNCKQGFSFEAKDVKLSKKRQHDAVNGDEKSATKEPCDTTTNHVFLDKKVLSFARVMQILLKILQTFTAELLAEFADVSQIYCLYLKS